MRPVRGVARQKHVNIGLPPARLFGASVRDTLRPCRLSKTFHTGFMLPMLCFLMQLISPHWSSPPLCFFTDGTCRNPQFQFARHSAWAVCFDGAPGNGERQQGMDFWAQTGTIPPSLPTRACGLVRGSQTMSRAELTAAVQAVRLGKLAGCIPTQVVTDSAYVVRIFHQFAAGLESSLLDSAPNLDLLHLLKAAWFSGVSVVKVKSHVAPAKADGLSQQWLQLGNAAADQACDRALSNDMSVVHDMIREIADRTLEQRDLLHAVFSYLLELNTVTQRLRQQEKSSSSQSPVDPADPPRIEGAGHFMEQKLRTWVQCRTATLPPVELPQPEDRVFVYNSFGPSFAWRVWRWIQTVQWTGVASRPHEAVISLELLCDFVASSAALPPLLIQNQQGRQIRLEFTAPEAQLHPQTLRTWLHALTSVLRQLERDTHTQLLAGEATRKATSLLDLGDRQPRSGFMARCQFQHPDRTSILLRSVLNHRTTSPFHEFVRQHHADLWVAPDHMEALASSVTPWKRQAQQAKRKVR